MVSAGTLVALGIRSGGGGAVVDFVGALVFGPTFAADVAVTGPIRTYVDFTGNIGGISHYGRLKYGLGHYSRIDAFQPILTGDLDIVGQQFFTGDLRPVVTFTGDLTFTRDMAGDLAPSVTFAGTVGLQVDLVGDMAPVVELGASLGVDLVFEAALDGGFAFTVVYGASGLISGPLWARTEPCPPSMWTPVEPCDSVEWKETALCNG